MKRADTPKLGDKILMQAHRSGVQAPSLLYWGCHREQAIGKDSMKAFTTSSLTLPVTIALSFAMSP